MSFLILATFDNFRVKFEENLPIICLDFERKPSQFPIFFGIGGLVSCKTVSCKKMCK